MRNSCPLFINKSIVQSIDVSSDISLRPGSKEYLRTSSIIRCILFVLAGCHGPLAMMNLFRSTGKHVQAAQTSVTVSSLLTLPFFSSRPLPPNLHLDPPAKDEILKRTSSSPSIPFSLTKAKSCSGISFKSQALYLVVYITRYLGSNLLNMSPPPKLTDLRNRHFLDLHKFSLEHDIQASLPRRAGIYGLPNA